MQARRTWSIDRSAQGEHYARLFRWFRLNHRRPCSCRDAVTDNRCKHIGYDEFNPDSWNSECAPDTEDWISPDTRGLCGVAKSYPEEFWACSDITISSGATKGFALR